MSDYIWYHGYYIAEHDDGSFHVYGELAEKKVCSADSLEQAKARIEDDMVRIGRVPREVAR
jgi:hypothetical protein